MKEIIDGTLMREADRHTIRNGNPFSCINGTCSVKDGGNHGTGKCMHGENVGSMRKRK